MAAKHYTVTLTVRQPQLEAGNWVEVESTSAAGPNLVEIRNAFYDKYGVQLMNANMSCFEIK
ncbi:MAG: hypothetical protein NC402_04650 [Prevotella sp.]|nr:hypothetical protein [Prevotella sp.]MCM1075025.1 hypothetical protein [Ruminococcus sp.]